MNRNTRRALAALATLSIFAGHSLAGDYYTSVPFIGSVKAGPGSTGAIPAHQVGGKEYSDSVDSDAFGNPRPTQNVSWDGIANPPSGNSGSVDAFAYNTAPGFPTQLQNPQVDSLANRYDALFRQVVKNEATLIFSVETDQFAPGQWQGLGPGAHIHWQDSTGDHAPWVLIEANPPLGSANHHPVRDLDAIEVWGPEPPSHTGGNTPVVGGYVGAFAKADSDRFSLAGDSITGTSMWNYNIGSKTVSPYIPHSVIVAAVEGLFLPNGQRYTDETRNQIDLDASMVYDIGEIGRWDVGDELLFSIRPIDAPLIDITVASIPGAAIDGGEIMHLKNLGNAFSVNYLSHGGHVWNTAFDVKGTFGYSHENIDGLEAIGALEGPNDVPVPEPSGIALAAIGLIAGCAWRSRRT